METGGTTFQIEGLGRENGKKTSFTVEALTIENARVKAELQGVEPTRVIEMTEGETAEEAISEAAKEPATSSVAGWTSRVSDDLHSPGNEPSNQASTARWSDTASFSRSNDRVSSPTNVGRVIGPGTLCIFIAIAIVGAVLRSNTRPSSSADTEGQPYGRAPGSLSSEALEPRNQHTRDSTNSIHTPSFGDPAQSDVRQVQVDSPRWPDAFASDRPDELPKPDLRGSSGGRVNEMAQAYAAAHGRKLGFNAHARRFPSLRSDLLKAEIRFDEHVRPAMKQIDAVLSHDVPQWDERSGDLLDRLDRRLRQMRFTRKQSNQFLSTARDGIEDDLPPGAYKALLSFHPTYIRRPEQEFFDGHTKRYITDGTGKARGLRIELTLPKSWTGKPGHRPHMIRTWTNRTGNAVNILALGVFPVPDDLPRNGRALGRTFLNMADMDLLPQSYAGAKEIEAGKVMLSLRPTVWKKISMKKNRAGVSMRTLGLSFITLYDHERMILFQFMTAKAREDGAILSQRLRQFGPLFRLITNSFIVHNQFEDY